MRLGIIGFGLDGGAERFGGMVEIALLPQRDPEGVVNVGLIRIKRSGLLEFGHGLGQLIFQF